MPIRLIAAWPLERYQLWLTFADGTEGALDLEDSLPARQLEPLRDLHVFRRLQVNRRSNTLEWPNGTDMAAGVLYRKLQRPPPRR
jgi:Protein of unknown function (DUF2442)